MSEQDGEAERRLQAVLQQARQLMPYPAHVVALPSARTLHRVVAAEGEVLPLVLASPAFIQPQFGPHARMESPWVMVIEGELRGEHLPDLLPYLEEAVKQSAQIVIAASDYDDTMLATLVVNRQRETVGVVALAPVDASDLVPLRRLAELAQCRPALVEGPRLHASALGSVPVLLMTPRETVAIGGPGAQPLALVYAGGDTVEDARSAATRLRAML